MQRGLHLAHALRAHLPERYEQAVTILLHSLTPAYVETEGLGLAGTFYLPHVSFVAAYGLDADGNGGRDPFEISMTAQYELTRRFTAEFSMRPFLIRQPLRTLARLPWARRIPALVQDPRPALPILDALKDDPSLYVRRSVANHLGDIAKDHPQLAFEVCAQWLAGASAERRWLIRHALRHLAKKGAKEALRLRHCAR